MSYLPWLLLIACWLGWLPAQAAQLDSIEPASVKQGTTVLLTLSGEDLPSGGNVQVEFFPQQIIVLNILSSTSSELSVQVRVADLAPAGSYNVLIYDLVNRAAGEVLGEGLLLVETDVPTPLFTGFDPKVIAEAENGFALLLTCEQLAVEAVPLLSMEWSHNGALKPSLVSTLSYGGTGKVVCAVEGKPPAGLLRGKIYLSGTPIYLVELSIQGEEALILGHSPAHITAGQPGLVKLFGAGISSSFLAPLSVGLYAAEAAIPAVSKELLDSSSFIAEFPAEIAPGDYLLQARLGDVVLYAGQLTVLEAALESTVASEPEDETAEEQAAAEVSDSQSDDAEQIAGGEQGADDAEDVVVEEVLIEEPPVDTALAEEVVEVAKTSEQPEAVIEPKVLNVTPETMPVGTASLRLEFAALEDVRLRLSQLEPELLVGSQPALLKFVGSHPDGFLCIFDAPHGAWPAGEDGLLLITDGASLEVLFSQRLPAAADPAAVGSSELPAETAVAEPVAAAEDLPAAEPQAALADVVGVTLVGNQAIVEAAGFSVELSHGGAQQSVEDWANLELSSSHTLFGPNCSKYHIELSVLGKGRLAVEFSPDSELLEEAASALLLEALVAQGPVMVSFAWPELDVELSVPLQFARD